MWRYAPDLEVSPAQAAPNEPFRLHGEGFFGDFVCNDTGTPDPSEPNGGLPTAGIKVEFVQGTRTWTLATVTSDEELSFDAGELEVPAGVTPGEAIVRAMSPSVGPEASPPQAEATFLVLDTLPGTGPPQDRPGAAG